MNCSEARTKIPLDVDGELPPAQSQALESHLASCPGCAREAARLRLLAATIAAWPAPDPPADFAAQVRARLGARQTQRTLLHPRRWALGFAAAVVVCGALWSGAYFQPALPWAESEWAVEVARTVLEDAVDQATSTYRSVPLWWRQLQVAAQNLPNWVEGTLGSIPAHPWWDGLMRGLWAALGFAALGNLLHHFHQRRMVIRVRRV